MKKKHIKEMIRKTYGEVKQSKPAEVHNEPVEALEEVGLDASAVETAVAALSGILGLPAVAFLSQKAQDKLKAVKSKVSLEEEYEDTDYDSLIGPVVVGMSKVRKYVEKEAPEHLSTFEAADEAFKAFDYVMAYGDGDDLGVPGDNALGLEGYGDGDDLGVTESRTKPVYKGAKAVITEADLIVETYKSTKGKKKRINESENYNSEDNNSPEYEAQLELANHPNYEKVVGILTDGGFEVMGVPYTEGTGKRDIDGIWKVIKWSSPKPGGSGKSGRSATVKDINDALQQAGINNIIARNSRSYTFRLTKIK